jgi:carboxylesterase type B
LLLSQVSTHASTQSFSPHGTTFVYRNTGSPSSSQPIDLFYLSYQAQGVPDQAARKTMMAALSTRPSVTLPQGQVIGIQLEEEFPVTVDAFLGIPYAFPPVGERRFKPAFKVPESTEPIDASKYGPAAPGKALLAGGPKLEQSEDCLTANIFRPATTSEASNMPVAVYIHGGAFNRGSATMHDTASMVAWSESPFIGVSFGYRIGALGFLPSSLSKKEGILNLGLRDQVHLLEWVRDNIAKFGGDPANVTLFGLSAGAHSVNLLPFVTSLRAISDSIVDRTPPFELQGERSSSFPPCHHGIWLTYFPRGAPL